MDLESELRAAMASHVSGVEAPSSLAVSVRQRHRRRVARIRVGVAAAAVGVGVAALWPAYHGISATPAGSSQRVATPSPSVSLSAASRVPGAPAPSSVPRSTAPSPTHGGSSPRPTRPSAVVSSSLGVSWVSYLPSWLSSSGPCGKTRFAGLPSTKCRWTGGTDWLMVQVVKAPTLVRAEQLGVPSLTLSYVTVHAQRAISTDGRLAWIERPGVGVVITSSSSLNAQLPKVADGIHP
jgi:hypothetical protein